MMYIRKSILVLFFTMFTLLYGNNVTANILLEPEEVCEEYLGGHYLFHKPLNLTYLEFVEKPNIENLCFLGDEGKYGLANCDGHTRTLGIFMRALRFENITTAVEEKYGLPQYTLLSMLMQETNGINYLPNGRNDGGIGLIHMQPALASQFGLKTFDGCQDLVCFNHGHELRLLITEYLASQEMLIHFDDRFHPVLNIDAAGRMLKYYSDLKCIGTDAWDSAHKRYAGKYNYKIYTTNLRYFKTHLRDTVFMAEVESRFNELNPDLKINGEPGDFKTFLAVNKEYNKNFELDRYKEALVENRP